MRHNIRKNTKVADKAGILTNNEGAILPILAASLLVLIMFIGGVIDFGTAMIARSRISAAIDSSALAAAIAPKGQDRNAIAARYYAANYETGFLGTDVTFQKLNVNIDDTGGNVSINNNNAVLQTKLLQVGGVQAIPIESAVQVAFKQNNSKPQDQDVMMVLDISNSMNGKDPSGVKKIDALKVAATNLIDSFIPTNIGDPTHNPNVRIGITTYNINLRDKVPLTSDKNVTKPFIAALTLQFGTCGSCGLKGAQELYASSPPPTTQRSDGQIYSPVKSVIFLTDGRMNETIIPGAVPGGSKPEAAAEALQKCSELKSNQTTVYTIGFGDDLDTQMLSDCASLDANSKPLFYRANNAQQLIGVFDSIFSSVNQTRITQ